jgi:hypothetical protein
MTDTRTLTLADFLLARIEEDWAAAKAVQSDYLNIVGTGDDPWPSEWAFAERFTVDRVLAECDAKRQIVAEHPRDDDGFCYDDSTHMRGCKWAWPCPTLRHLALPHADHPDFREEWKS